jgi:23S rRNA pseudouridine1911/1915/1917 synthase
MATSYVEKEIIVSLEQDGLRLDTFLSFYVSSRSQAEKIIKRSLVKVKKGSKYFPVEKSSSRVKAGECYLVFFPEIPKAMELKPYDLAVPVLYEDEHLLVVNKPAGLVVHPGPGHEQDTLVNTLIGKTNLSVGVDPLRPGIVHRLDKDVSGLMLLSKTEKARDLLIEGFKLKKIKRIYRALTAGKNKEEAGRVTSFIGRHPRDRKKFYSFNEEMAGSKKAVTYYRVLESFQDKIYHVQCRLETGRTHQIRVHLSSMGLPVLGDEVYFPPRRQLKFLNSMKIDLKKATLPLPQVALYSAFLELSHPLTKKELSFSLSWPKSFHSFMDQLSFKVK